MRARHEAGGGVLWRKETAARLSRAILLAALFAASSARAFEVDPPLKLNATGDHILTDATIDARACRTAAKLDGTTKDPARAAACNPTIARERPPSRDNLPDRPVGLACDDKANEPRDHTHERGAIRPVAP
jgi:hypothetical protein